MMDELKAKLTKYGQTHVLAHWDKLMPEEQESLRAELQAVDLEELQRCYTRTMLDSPVLKLDDVMQPVPSDFMGHASSAPEEQLQKWETEGLRRVSEGKVAALLLAGGQGTRLGSDRPKGMYELKLPSGATLFELQAHRIRRLEQMAAEKFGKQGVVPWYIMTSGATRPATEKFFIENNYFGLDPKNVFLFEQLQIPCLDNEGKMFLATKSSIARAPDGNGGLYEAMAKFGVLDDMIKRGIEDVHVYCVDNILVKVGDPMFVGFCRDKGAPAGAKVVGKSAPHEKVGVVCLCNGKYQVVEYSEISDQTAEKRNEDGRLTFSAGNIANHYFTVDFLKEACAKHKQLKHHVANKKIPHVGADGRIIKPSEPNGIKMEKFVFDVFQFANDLAVLEVERATGFSPLKNAPGAAKDTLETCQRDLFAMHRAWLRAAGAVFVDADDKELPDEVLSVEHQCEISPLVSYGGEGLAERVKACPRMKFPVLLK
eukprot:m.16964 g.16964  ORF g.16964 m.16964 type:complete len:484 (+) comp5363_c0_seq1:138-1589(+)